MKKSNQSSMVMGIAIYLPHQYARLLATAEDADHLNPTWDEWRAVCEETKRNLRAIGIEPIDVLVDMDDFVKYCAERGLKNVGGTRAEYVAERLAEVRGQKSEVGSQRSVVGGRRSQVGKSPNHPIT